MTQPMSAQIMECKSVTRWAQLHLQLYTQLHSTSPTAVDGLAGGAPDAQIAGAPALPVELLEEIFLLLDAPDDLARASAACPAFRRVVTGRRFLRRYRSLHPPPVLGFLNSDQPVTFIPADPPHRNAPAARALARAADFSFAFLPAPNAWRVCDALDARVLLRRRAGVADAFSDDLVVCDPLHRRYVQLPRIPHDLAVSTGVRGMPFPNFNCFLDPASKEEQDVVSFGVIGAVQFQHKLVTFHFPSVTGKWHALTFDREVPLRNARFSSMFKQHYAHGCFYWTFLVGSTMAMQNTPEMRLCNFEIPAATSSLGQHKVLFEVGPGRLGLLALHDGIFDLYCKTLPDSCVGTQEWQHDRTIPLPELDSAKLWWMVGALKGYLLLTVSQGFPAISQQMPRTQYFTLDLNTFLVERLSLSIKCRSGYLYASVPPPLSLPSI